MRVAGRAGVPKTPSSRKPTWSRALPCPGDPRPEEPSRTAGKRGGERRGAGRCVLLCFLETMWLPLPPHPHPAPAVSIATGSGFHKLPTQYRVVALPAGAGPREACSEPSRRFLRSWEEIVEVGSCRSDAETEPGGRCQRVCVFLPFMQCACIPEGCKGPALGGSAVLCDPAGLRCLRSCSRGF